MERRRWAGMGEFTTSAEASETVKSSMAPAASSCMLSETAAIRGFARMRRAPGAGPLNPRLAGNRNQCLSSSGLARLRITAGMGEIVGE
jgi:hypothetical protein